MEERMNEKIYKVMGLTGASSIAAGIVILVVGVATGVISIVSGCLLLKRRKNVIF